MFLNNDKIYFAPIPHRVLGRISERITNELPAVSRVVYDITGNPPRDGGVGIIALLPTSLQSAEIAESSVILIVTISMINFTYHQAGSILCITNNKVGDGKIFIYDVENVIKIRTGEMGYNALQDSEPGDDIPVKLGSEDQT